MKTPWLLMLTAFLMSGKALALASHSAEEPAPSSSPTTKREDLLHNNPFAQIPAIDPPSPTYQKEESVAALMLSLWSLNSGQTPTPALLAQAGLDDAKVKAFVKGLPSTAKLNSTDRENLRKSYNKDAFTDRNFARTKYLNFISRFQEAFPQAADVVPELLTVWGEARNIRGFDEIDSINQQAKMATVVHVIRNRTTRRSEERPGRPSYKDKWHVVTRRYQFSAFEPYDPNLAELAFGPRTSGTLASVNSLPRNDQIALTNLAKVIASMNRGEILLSSPLVHNNTYHYLTPTLLNYTKENLASLKAQIQRAGRRLAMVQIPSANPQFISAVPRWSKQSALISHPPVKIKEVGNPTFQTQVVSPSDFIYFRGIR